MATTNGHLVLVGTTASGKSALAMEMARMRPGVELVSMDSMQIYRGMDIGTATPTPQEQAEVRHHLLDIVDPGEEFAVSEFKARCTAVLADLDERGVLGVLVGGTGLHVRAVVDDLEIPGRFEEVRDDLESEPDTSVLHERLRGLDAVAADRMEPTNRRRVIRALEVCIGAGRPFSSFGPGLDSYPESPFTQVGVRLPRPVVDRRLAERYEQQVAAGFVDEVRTLASLPGGLSRTARQALGYRQLLEHLEGRCGLEEAINAAVVATRRFARRQERWFRRDPRITWMDAEEDPMEVLNQVLAALDGCSDER
ncbi:MAG TPA: tRNA (adenosine(37)-N6)-dimethylallyltransferase MiaA [Acidimicrobiales bacterium]|jgi:tRNA dimethylallyltransferase|nr:tRNA (adenosine(37)-N6)-dimethylallyltransferase MiaA [Actinomycetota bacterium]MDP6062546.1 tRNA (adenosine(37)-N6)-dimethylallyltransferase MiaA [Acidimicrobiales bacterium]MDP6213842.1 tRNA (adenosine(37)-N6)-dimethylallyltransferase MiaA [Acidimicrobiales bacterium]MDP7208721.1 tRNA (adenosine(37)-N6)-dimethylallyltransferase MiaA [Acidimicrobiales bacterium]HJL89082.1 tRNA (adenosine(37)-N6)-dimethylallyltransferase MiaA [Acidimicrobiales bacterium]|tara:strand:+ start:16350 stop:17279 length:930 start_codon:yes stop_codon:yes gene_type:complete